MSNHESFAKKSDYNIQYQTLPNKFSKTPTFCTKEPLQDPTLPESLVPIIMKKTKSNIDAWIGPLKSISQKNAKWDINYVEISRDKQESYDYAKCDVLISYSKTPPTGQAQGLEVLGQQYIKDGINHVDIFYQGYGVCETRDDTWVYWYTCKEDSPKLVVVMEAVLRHELGHAMGLGHYTSAMTAYLAGRGHQSSIMVPIVDVLANPAHTPLDPELLEIMPVDLAKLKEIYGDMGWGSQVQKSDVKLPAPSKSPTKTIQIKRGQTITEKITGMIPSGSHQKGQQVDVSTTFPDGMIKTQKILISSSGKFEHVFLIRDYTTPGKYQITISYSGMQVKTMTYKIEK